jgi:hypothetical protein
MSPDLYHRRVLRALIFMDLTLCPQCGALAEVTWRGVAESTDGPVEHAKVVCVRRHWFLLPLASLERALGGSSGELAA